MAVKLLSGASSGSKPSKKLSAVKKPEVSLPEERTTPPSSIVDYSFLIYGVQKIGKTSFSTNFDDALHFMFEPSGKAFSLFEVQPRSWLEFVAYLDLLEKKKKAGDLKYKSFVIDTVDLLYSMCSDHVCSLIGIEHPGDINDYGKTWNNIGETFRKQIVRLATLGGFVALTHEVEKEVETRSGRKYQSITPSAQKRCNLILSKFCDLTGNYYIKDDGERVLRIVPSEDAEAGNRIDTEDNPRFRWKGTTEPIKEIPMGSSSKEAFENFSKAFANELEKPKPKPVTKKKTSILDGAKKKPTVK